MKTYSSSLPYKVVLLTLCHFAAFLMTKGTSASLQESRFQSVIRHSENYKKDARKQMQSWWDAERAKADSPEKLFSITNTGPTGFLSHDFSITNKHSHGMCISNFSGTNLQSISILHPSKGKESFYYTSWRLTAYASQDSLEDNTLVLYFYRTGMVKRMAFWGRDRFVGKCLDYDRSGRLIKEYPVDGMLFLPVHPLEDPRHGVK